MVTRPPGRGRWHGVRVVSALCGLLVLLCACVAAPATSAADPPTARIVQVVNHGWHTGLVLRADDMPAGAWPVKVDFPDAVYLEVGWGDRAYYMAADPGAWLALKAAAWPTPGVLHVVALQTPIERFFPHAESVAIGVSPAGLQRLLEHLRNSHQLDDVGHPIMLGPGLYGRSRFYASRERFHLFKNCNVWVATALQAAGAPVTPALAITAEQLMVQLRPLAKVTP
jgi:uncharacterized protein (TIGR02117 family)